MGNAKRHGVRMKIKSAEDEVQKLANKSILT